MRCLELDEQCSVIQHAAPKTIEDHHIRTADLQETPTTSELVEGIGKEIIRLSP